MTTGETVGMKKEVIEICRWAETHGWTVTKRRGNHLRFDPPGGGKPVFGPATPSDYRGVRNFEQKLRRRGLPRRDHQKTGR